jgi:hypothetical protein
MTSISIITATTGGEFLKHAIESVQNQKTEEKYTLNHVIVIDGPEYDQAVRDIVSTCDVTNVPVSILQLPFNTGKDGYLCHRIYGAVPLLLNTDFITYLDDDNVMERDHIQTIMSCIEEKGARWGYTLRTIVDETNTEITKDCCESLGLIRPTCINDLDRHIDTNCYMFNRELAVQLAPIWHRRTRDKKPGGILEADRQIAQTLIQNEPSGACTRRFTIRYRVGNRMDSVREEFFEKGNANVDSIDFDKKDIYLFFHMDTDTKNVLSNDSSNAFVTSLKKSYNVFNGYTCMRGLPNDAVVISIIEDPLQYLETLRQLKLTTHGSMKRIVVLTKDINVPKNFPTDYADTLIQSFGLDFKTSFENLQMGIHAADGVDVDVKGVCTTENTRTIYKIVQAPDIEKTWSDGYVPLVWKGDSTVSENIQCLEGSNWVDISKSEEYCTSKGITGERHEQVKEYLQMNHYMNEDIAKTMLERIREPIRKAVSMTLDYI